MSAVDTTDAVLQEALTMALAEDGSHVEDIPALVETLAELGKIEKSAVTAFRKSSTLIDQCAAFQAHARTLILLASGHPDWKAESAAYRNVIDVAESEILAGFGTVEGSSDEAKSNRKARDTFRNSVRQSIRRNYFEAEVTNYVLPKVEGLDPSTLKWTEGKQGRPAVLAEVTHAGLRKAIADEYKAAKYDVPVKVGGAVKAKSGAGPEGEKSDPKVEMGSALATAVESTSPDVALGFVHRAVTALYDKTTANPASLAEAGSVAASWKSIEILARNASAILAGKEPSNLNKSEVESARWTK